MGLGDWLMATAEAKYFNEKYQLPVVFQNKKTGRIYWEGQIFRGNPRIRKNPAQGEKVVVVENHSGRRPYIKSYTPEKVTWNEDFKVSPGEVYLSNDEINELPGYVIIEPHTKDRPMNRNKAWDWDRWQRLVDSVSIPWVQFGPKGTRSLKGVKFIETEFFREVLGYLGSVKGAVTTDGALHHACGAMEVPAVVLWGGLIHPRILGYDFHTNLCHEDNHCGSIVECKHCKEAMNRIQVEEVIESVKRMYGYH